MGYHGYGLHESESIRPMVTANSDISVPYAHPPQVVVGYWKDEDTQHKIAVWMRVCAGWADSQDMLIIRFGDQMNNVAVTDGDKVEAEQRMGYHVDYCPASELMEYHKNIKDTDVEALVATYFNEYDHDASLEDKSTEAYQKVWNAAKAELALRAILKPKAPKDSLLILMIWAKQTAATSIRFRDWLPSV